jgi:membrane protein YdbS with pleckstrin-like domain
MPTLHHYVDAAIAVAIMLTLSVVAGFLAFGLTDDRSAIAVTMVTVFLLTAAVLLFRIWLSSSSAVKQKKAGTP